MAESTQDTRVARELGEIQATVKAQGAQISELRADVKTLLDLAARTKGGWFALAAAGGLGGAIVAAVVKLLGLVKGGG